jgi:hypothetical protein
MARELASGQRVTVKVVQQDDLVVVDQASRERRSDEARAAREHNALTVKRHAASLVFGLAALPRSRRAKSKPGCGRRSCSY